MAVPRIRKLFPIRVNAFCLSCILPTLYVYDLALHVKPGRRVEKITQIASMKVIRNVVETWWNHKYPDVVYAHDGGDILFTAV